MKTETFDGGMNLESLIFRIGEITKITGVSARQLRYWDKKGYIQSTRDDENSSRVYSFYSLLKVVLIKKFLDQGYTLNASIDKMESRKEELKLLHGFFKKAYHGFDQIDNRKMINLGNLDSGQQLYGYLDDDGNASYKIMPK